MLAGRRQRLLLPLDVPSGPVGVVFFSAHVPGGPGCFEMEMIAAYIADGGSIHVCFAISGCLQPLAFEAPLQRGTDLMSDSFVIIVTMSRIRLFRDVGFRIFGMMDVVFHIARFGFRGMRALRLGPLEPVKTSPCPGFPANTFHGDGLMLKNYA